MGHSRSTEKSREGRPQGRWCYWPASLSTSGPEWVMQGVGRGSGELKHRCAGSDQPCQVSQLCPEGSGQDRPAWGDVPWSWVDNDLRCG
jgi:hypothetical protein